MDLKSVGLAGLIAATCLTGCTDQLAKDAALKHFAKGQVLAYQGDLDAALDELIEAIKANPNLSVFHTAVGDIHRRQGNYELAVRSYNTACDANPYAFLPHYNLGVTYQTLAKLGSVVEQVNEYLRLATGVYIRAVTLRPDDFEANLNLSVCYFQLGKNDLAEQYCRRAIEIDPDSTYAYSNLGIICDRQGRLYDAIRAYKASLERDAHQSPILVNLGATYMRQNRFDAALEAFQLAAEADPASPRPWERMGALHYQRSDMAGALASYEKAVALDPDSATAYRGIGVIHMTQFVKDTSRASLRDQGLAAWNASLEIDPDQSDLIRLVKKYTPQYTGPKL